jgi:hypothetical protein
MRGTIEIDIELSDEYVAEDVRNLLELMLPYIGDNVIVRTHFEE